MFNNQPHERISVEATTVVFNNQPKSLPCTAKAARSMHVIAVGVPPTTGQDSRFRL
jgi:hypothetical protein